MSRTQAERHHPYRINTRIVRRLERALEAASTLERVSADGPDLELVLAVSEPLRAALEEIRLKTQEERT